MPAARHGVAALTARFKSDLFELSAVGPHAARSRRGLERHSYRSPSVRWRTGRNSATTVLNTTTSGRRICRRLKARSWAVNSSGSLGRVAHDLDIVPNGRGEIAATEYEIGGAEH